MVLVLLTNIMQSYAMDQQTYSLKKVVSPSPTAASLEAYGDIPVNTNKTHK